MKKLIFHSLVISICLTFHSCISQNRKLEVFINSRLEFAIEQYTLMEASLPEGRLPRSIDKEGNFTTSNSKWWCSGFYPGTLWYLYEYSGNEQLKQLAHERSMLLEVEKDNKGTHDLGFMLYCSFGNGFRLTGEPEYIDIMLTGARSLMSRFNATVGLIKSWDHGKWQYPVIIDNMMNLEFLFWAAKESNDTSMYKLCITHADNSIKHLFRQDHSSFHLSDFDTLTGQRIKQQTVQGFSDESAWARGQAWGLYGYTVMFRETGDEKYLQHAQNIAQFILHHPNLPANYIPYWDFNAPDIPNALRDASAAAIIASALIELSDYTTGSNGEKYFEAAKTILLNLGSKEYLAEKGENRNFILKHSVGHLPAGSEVDVPLTYADYYFVEGLLRLKERL